MTWEQAEEQAKPVLVCPLCQGRDFDQEQARMDSHGASRATSWSCRSASDVGSCCSSPPAEASSTSTEFARSQTKQEPDRDDQSDRDDGDAQHRR